MLYADIAIDPSRDVNSTFTYHIPASLEGQIVPGSLVRISFGTAMMNGIVLSAGDAAPNFTTKPILDLLDPQPVMTPAHLDLARWLSRTYLAPMGACLWLMLPPGLTKRGDILYTLIDSETSSDEKVIDLLRERMRRQLVSMHN